MPLSPIRRRLSEGRPCLYYKQGTTKVYMFAKSIQGLKCLLRAFKSFMHSLQELCWGTETAGHKADGIPVLPELVRKREKK